MDEETKQLLILIEWWIDNAWTDVETANGWGEPTVITVDTKDAQASRYVDNEFTLFKASDIKRQINEVLEKS